MCGVVCGVAFFRGARMAASASKHGGAYSLAAPVLRDRHRGAARPHGGAISPRGVGWWPLRGTISRWPWWLSRRKGHTAGSGGPAPLPFAARSARGDPRAIFEIGLAISEARPLKSFSAGFKPWWCSAVSFEDLRARTTTDCASLPPKASRSRVSLLFARHVDRSWSR